jgi:hypothetical protein
MTLSIPLSLIVSLVLMMLLAWVIAQRELSASPEGRADRSGR